MVLIDRWRFIAAVVLCFVSILARADAEVAPVRPVSPNIVFILADDLGYTDLAAYGSEINTPTLNALAEQGLRWRDSGGV